MSFLLARMRAYQAVLGAAVLISLATGVLLSALAAFDSRALDQAAADRLAAADTSITVTAALPYQQFGQLDGTLRGAVRRALGGVPAGVQDTLLSNQLVLGAVGSGGSGGSAGSTGSANTPGSTKRLIQAAAPQDLAGHARLTAGAWPAGQAGSAQIQTAVPDSVAAGLHLSVGSVVTAIDQSDHSTLTFKVSGLFQPDQPSAAYWNWNQVGPGGALDSTGSVTFGPFVLASGTFTGGQVAVNQAAWVFSPDPAALAGASPAALSAGLTTFARTTVQAPGFDGAQVTSSLPAELSALAAVDAVAHTIVVISALQLIILALTALVLAARALGPQRAGESALLIQRGRSPRQAFRTDLAESALLGVVVFACAAPAGARLAGWLTGVGPLAGAHLAIGSVPAPSWLGAGAVAAALLLALLLSGRRGGRWGVLRRRRNAQAIVAEERSGRQQTLAASARGGMDIALLALTGLALWQQHTLPLVQIGSDGAPTVNVLVELTPVLALCSGALLALRLLPLAARVGQARAQRSSGLSGAMIAWQLGRRPTQQSGWAFLVVLAVSTGTLALSQHATWLRSTTDQSRYAVGAQLQVTPGPNATPGYDGAIEQATGVRAATPVVQLSGADGSTVLAVGATTASQVTLLRSDQFPDGDAQTWAKLQPAASGAARAVPLPGNSGRIQFSASVTPATPGASAATLPSRFAVTATVRDADGMVYQVQVGTLAADGRNHALSGNLAAAGGRDPVRPLSLIGINVGYQAPTSAQTDVTVTISGLPGAAWSASASSNDLATDAQNSAQDNGIAPIPPPARQPAVSAAPTDGNGGWSYRLSPGFGQNWQYDTTSVNGIGVNEVTGTSAAGAVLSLAPQTPGSVPVLATASFLTAAHVAVGGSTQIAADGVTLPAIVVGTVATFPTLTGPQGGLVADLSAVDSDLIAQDLSVLTPGTWWLSTDQGRIPPDLPAKTSVVSLAAYTEAQLGDPMGALPQQGLLIVAAGAAVLALITLAGAVLGNLRERRRQSAVLVALGVSTRRQAGLAAWECAVVSIPAAVFGLALGVGLAWLLVPSLTLSPAAAVPVPGPLLTLDWPWALPLAGLAAAVPILAGALGAATRLDVIRQLRAATRES